MRAGSLHTVDFRGQVLPSVSGRGLAAVSSDFFFTAVEFIHQSIAVKKMSVFGILLIFYRIVMEKEFYHVYREIEDRFVKICWTHKVQEFQADLHLKKSNTQKWLMAIANGVTTTTAFVSVVTNALETANATWLWPAITAVIAVFSSIFTLRYKDGVLDDKANACKQYAAKCRHIRNKYESLLADVKSGSCDIKELRERRDNIADEENTLYAGDIAPYTTEKAVKLARKSLLQNKDTLTEEHEIKSIVPMHLQEL